MNEYIDFILGFDIDISIRFYVDFYLNNVMVESWKTYGDFNTNINESIDVGVYGFYSI